MRGSAKERRFLRYHSQKISCSFSRQEAEGFNCFGKALENRPDNLSASRGQTVIVIAFRKQQVLKKLEQMDSRQLDAELLFRFDGVPRALFRVADLKRVIEKDSTLFVVMPVEGKADFTRLKERVSQIVKTP